MSNQPAPRFTAGQRVRIIANQGGLYAAQIGVIGFIERKRQYRRWGYHTYDVCYCDAKGREKRIVSMREDDLEPVEPVEASAAEPVTDEPPTPSEQPPAPFKIGQRVTVHPAINDAEDEYPSFTHYPIVGEIVSACQISASGLHCYDVRFPRIVGGVSSEWWPPVVIREAHLVPEPIGPGWMAASAASTKREERPLMPLSEPKFSVGEHVYVDPRSEPPYERYARKGAIGVITAIGKSVRGIRRYDVRYAGTREATLAAQRHPLHALPVTQVREEHLVSDEGRLRHACEYRAEKQLRADEKLWCDKGGCFEDDCVVCQQTPEWRERHGLPLTTLPAPTPKPAKTPAPTTPAETPALAKANAPVLTLACARGGRVDCDHDWQTGWDSRYRLCRKCKRAERMADETESEARA